jgi:hypothetical protein
MRSRLTGCATKFGPLSGRKGVGAAALVVSSTIRQKLFGVATYPRSQSVCLLTQCGEGVRGGYYTQSELVGQPPPARTALEGGAARLDGRFARSFFPLARPLGWYWRSPVAAVTVRSVLRATILLTPSQSAAFETVQSPPYPAAGLAPDSATNVSDRPAQSAISGRHEAVTDDASLPRKVMPGPRTTCRLVRSTTVRTQITVNGPGPRRPSIAQRKRLAFSKKKPYYRSVSKPA